MAAIHTFLLLIILSFLQRLGSCIKWNPVMFENCGELGDGVMKAELCYQKYESEILTGTSSFCCPNWRLAHCLITSTAPICDESTRKSLKDYWINFLTNSQTCESFAEHLDIDASMPSSCAWYYHWVLISRVAAGSFVVLLIIVLVIAAVIHNRRKIDQLDALSSYESFNFGRKRRRGTF